MCVLVFALLSLGAILKCPLPCASDVRRELRVYGSYIEAGANIADAVAGMIIDHYLRNPVASKVGVSVFRKHIAKSSSIVIKNMYIS